jgi:hypothetical protein
MSKRRLAATNPCAERHRFDGGRRWGSGSAGRADREESALYERPWKLADHPAHDIEGFPTRLNSELPV